LVTSADSALNQPLGLGSLNVLVTGTPENFVASKST